MTDFWTTLSTVATAVGTLVVAIFTALTAWATKRTVREMARGGDIANARALQHKILDHLAKVIPQCQDLEDEIEEQDKIIRANEQLTRSAEEQQQVTNTAIAERASHAKRLFAIWETAAAGLNAKAFDFEIFYNVAGARVLAHYQQLAHFVRERRRKEGLGIYDQLMITIDKLIENNSSAHLITQRTLRKLKANYVSGRVTDQLEVLRGRLFDDYKELVDVLVRKGLETEKDQILQFSRVFPYYVKMYAHIQQQEPWSELVQPLDETTKGQVFQLFSKAWPHVRTQWPQYLTNLTLDDPKLEHTAKAWISSELGHEDYDYYGVFYQRPTEKADKSSNANRTLVGFVSLQPVTIQDTNWKEALSLKDHECGNYIAIRLFLVAHEYQGRGIGRMLLRRAITAIQLKRHKQPVAAVPKGSSAAIHLCKTEGGFRLPTSHGNAVDYYLF